MRWKFVFQLLGSGLALSALYFIAGPIFILTFAIGIVAFVLISLVIGHNQLTTASWTIRNDLAWPPNSDAAQRELADLGFTPLASIDMRMGSTSPIFVCLLNPEQTALAYCTPKSVLFGSFFGTKQLITSPTAQGPRVNGELRQVVRDSSLVERWSTHCEGLEAIRDRGLTPDKLDPQYAVDRWLAHEKYSIAEYRPIDAIRALPKAIAGAYRKELSLSQPSLDAEVERWQDQAPPEIL